MTTHHSALISRAQMMISGQALVTREAARIELHLVCRLLVATFARELAVRSGERESGLLAVIEFP